ncbi:potassium channel AKT1-like [Lycium barbarum]|uniref:potassium channel AKT1-like n=1 Tax=Lycium barbarum TaxID=112863 RepID=UPI00293E1721|nr:potassium channel AKT1-like [Lycium barbarum]
MLRRFIVSPYERLYRAWEIFLVVLVIYTAWMSPFELGFLKEQEGPLSIIDNVVNAFFAIDIILTFFVAYLDKTTYLLVDDHKQIAWKYARTWFVIDAISTIPSELARKITPTLVRQYGLFNLLRVWRLRRVVVLFARLEQDRNFNFFRVRRVKCVCVTIFFVHCAGCFNHLIAINYPNPTKTWIGHSMDDFLNKDIWIRYVTAIYWSIATLTRVGYGDLHPMNTREMIFNIFYMLFTFCLKAYLIGNMTNFVIHGTSRTNQSVTCRDPLPETEHMLTHAKIFPTRVTVSCPEKGDITGDLILVTRSFQELLDIGYKIYGIKQAKVLINDWAEIDDFELIRDGDHLIFVSDQVNAEPNN